MVVPRSANSDFCWACGPEDPTGIGDDQFMITSEYNIGSKREYENQFWCAKHFSFLLDLGLTHLVRVDKGRESGPLKLPLIRSAA